MSEIIQLAGLAKGCVLEAQLKYENYRPEQNFDEGEKPKQNWGISLGIGILSAVAAHPVIQIPMWHFELPIDQQVRAIQIRNNPFVVNGIREWLQAFRFREASVAIVDHPNNWGYQYLRAMHDFVACNGELVPVTGHKFPLCDIGPGWCQILIDCDWAGAWREIEKISPSIRCSDKNSVRLPVEFAPYYFVL